MWCHCKRNGLCTVSWGKEMSSHQRSSLMKQRKEKVNCIHTCKTNQDSIARPTLVSCEMAMTLFRRNICIAKCCLRTPLSLNRTHFKLERCRQITGVKNTQTRFLARTHTWSPIPMRRSRHSTALAKNPFLALIYPTNALLPSDSWCRFYDFTALPSSQLEYIRLSYWHEF